MLPCKETKDTACSQFETYVSANSPEPMPVNINISLKFYDVIGVNEADQTITLTLKAVIEWQDHRIDVNRSQKHIDKYDKVLA